MSIHDLKESFKQTPLEEMKQFVLSFSRGINLETGNALPIASLNLKAIHLNPKQKGALFDAFDALVIDGVFVKENDTLILTAAGREVLY